MKNGDSIGKYRLVRRLGQGGMGEVWLATATGHGGFSKTVVLKTLLEEYSRDPLFIEMLANEARICAKLSHPNLIEVFDFTENAGIYLLAMEHVVGRPLHHIVKATKLKSWSVPAWFALRVAWECCRGLAYAHEQGVIHCDLSPSNIMVTFTGITKILDFGVAHSLSRGPKADCLKGKFSYMAPERIKSLATDCRTDIYALGVMLYLIFTGQLPFTAANDSELLYKIVKTRPRPPSELAPVDSRIERLILRAMQPDPAKRYQTMGDVLAELSPCLEGQLGTYGQHDVASFVGRLFEKPDLEAAARGLPTVPPPPRAVNDTEQSAYVSSVDVIEEMEVEGASALLEIPIESAPVRATALPLPLPSPNPAPRVSPNVVRIARGSASSQPIDKNAPERQPLESPSKLFTHLPEMHEARTTVQSLFGERPSLGFGGPSRIFDRPPLGTHTDMMSDDEDETPPEPVQAAPEPEPSPEPEVAPRRGGFGSYSISRPKGQKVWPWSRSQKPD